MDLIPAAPAPPADGTAGSYFAACYAELRRLARCHVLRSARDLSLGATGLVHEAYLDMAPRANRFADRERFLAYASRVMRACLVDHLRRVRTRKRGSAFALAPLPDDVGERATPAAHERARVGQALAGLACAEPQLADIVELHFYGGYTYAEIASLRGMSERTVQRSWRRARMYLRDAIRAPLTKDREDFHRLGVEAASTDG